MPGLPLSLQHRLVHLLQKYLLNPPIKIFLFAIGIAPMPCLKLLVARRARRAALGGSFPAGDPRGWGALRDWF
jgi:hypothetical protein